MRYCQFDFDVCDINVHKKKNVETSAFNECS